MRVYIIILFFLLIATPVHPFCWTSEAITENSHIIPPYSHVETGIIPKYAIDQAISVNWTTILDDMGLAWLHEQGFNGSGINVGVIDNGVDFLHETYDNATNPHFEKSFAPLGNASTQTHGTPVAGVMIGDSAAGLNGSSPGATLFSAEMGSDSGDAVILGNFTEAMMWLVSNGVNIINTSFGGFFNWTLLVELARDFGVVLVGSAGNDGINSPPSGPAADPYGIAVGGLASLNLVDIRSSRGPTTTYLQKPDVVSYFAVESTNVISGTSTYLGTSFASPIVAGGIASVMEALTFYGKTWNPGSIKSALIESSTSIIGSIDGQGAGFPNFTRMLEILNTTRDHGTVFPSQLPEEFDSIPRGLDEVLPVQVVSSFPANSSISLEGDLSQVLTINPSTDFTSLPFRTNTQGKTDGIYTGKIVLNVNGTVVSNESLSIEVKGDLKGIVGVDYYHSVDYVDGIENLLNRNNDWVKDLRDNYLWLKYILSEFTNEQLADIDILLLKNIFVEGSDFAAEFTSMKLSSQEKDALTSFAAGGGRIFTIFDSQNADAEEINQVLEIGGINIIDQNQVVVERNVELINYTYITKHTSLLTFTGFDMEGGVSLFKQGSGLVIGTGSNKYVASSSMQFLENLQLFVDTMLWLTMPELYLLTSIDRSDLTINLQYSGASNEDEATLVLSTYSGTVLSSTAVNISVANANGSISFNGVLGEYNVIITSSNSDNYLQVSSINYPELIFDFFVPSLTFLGSDNDLVLNLAEGEERQRLAYHYDDNNEVDIRATIISYVGENNELVTLTFEFSTSNSTLWFYVDSSFFNNTIYLPIEIKLFDLSGNMVMSLVSIKLIPIPVTDPSIEAVSSSLGLTDEPVLLQRGEFLVHVLSTFVVMLILLAIPLVIIYSKGKGM